MAPVSLESPRLRLRPWRDSDAQAYMAILSDPEVLRQIGSGAFYRAKRMAASVLARATDLEARRAIARLRRHWARNGFGEWAVEEKASGSLIGKIGFVHHPDWRLGPSQVEIGWTLARSRWGQGLATEGAAAALDDAFTRLELDWIISIARKDNARSERVMAKLGMLPQGETRWRGSDMVWYAIDKSAWLRRDEPAAAASSR